MSKKKILTITFIFFAIALLSVFGYFGFKQYMLSKIDSFDKCSAAGIKVQETYPATCVVNGKTFTQSISPPVVPPVTTPTTPITPDIQALAEPITNALTRVTKKPFGIYITPASSPVQPEKFAGYHTGTDFEISANEEDTIVPIKSICDGTVRYEGVIEGYGGVVIINCSISGKEVTVIYGHIDIDSVTLLTGDTVSKGNFIANLGLGYSMKTAGERKHLHLGIHTGSNIEYRGYVQNKNELSGWLNFQDIFK